MSSSTKIAIFLVSFALSALLLLIRCRSAHATLDTSRSLQSDCTADCSTAQQSIPEDLANARRAIEHLEQRNHELQSEITALRAQLKAKDRHNVATTAISSGHLNTLVDSGLSSSSLLTETFMFEGFWKKASPEEWDAIERRHGCRSEGFREHVQCCDATLFPNFTTPIDRLVFTSDFAFSAHKLERLLRGGTISFIGDSITAQIFNSLRARAAREKYIISTSEIQPPLSTLSVDIIHTRTGSKVKAFTATLYRADKATNIEEFLDASLVANPTPRSEAQHVAVVNIGLHFSDKSEDQTERFKEQIVTFADALVRFNKQPNCFGFFREITPQHFKSVEKAGQGDYFSRDRSINHCAPWEAMQRQSYRNNLLNQILAEVAAKRNLIVQPVTKFLAPRHDAHLETRFTEKNNVLDCTHWCAQVFDVFEDGLMAVLFHRFGAHRFEPKFAHQQKD
eukprot:m.95892 g.95892  ORF g.95892 m.95892 type:complete len:452 (+) comp14775_c0_seq2:154-1509(+)